MSNRDYTKFSTIKETVKDDVIQNGVSVQLTEELNTEEQIDAVLDVVENTTEVVEETTKAKVIGVVVDCLKLNIRKTPNPTGEVIGTIDVDSEVTIDEDESTGNFYKICTAAGAEGYCMKQFIQIKQ